MQTQTRSEIRISLPSKGRLAEDCLAFLSDCQECAVPLPVPSRYAGGREQGELANEL